MNIFYLLTVFYLASVNARIEENSERSYLLRIGRGGSFSNEADVTVNINDYNARYGTDYTVSLLDGYKAKKDENPEKDTDPVDNQDKAGSYLPVVLGGTGILLAGIIIVLLLTKKKKCPNCGKKVDKDDEICPHCGYDLTDKK